MKKTIPNILSFARLFFAPIFFFLFLSEDKILQQTSIIIFLVASLTDYYDGYFARKYSIVSSTGKFIDPLADKFLTTAALLVFFLINLIPLWMVLVIIIRDLLTTLLRVYQKSDFNTSFSARVKTSLQMLVISIILLTIFIMNLLNDNNLTMIINNFLYSKIIYSLFFILTLLTIYTFFEYLFKLFKEKSNHIIK
jgi:CDP-diacylglycerol--glycerol-3-phosphate 3-phosphatidyltransferase